MEEFHVREQFPRYIGAFCTTPGNLCLHVFGSREEAELRARAMINDWLKRRPTQNPKSKLTPTFLRNHGGEEELPLLSSGR
jgi:hypothetical protein